MSSSESRLEEVRQLVWELSAVLLLSRKILDGEVDHGLSSKEVVSNLETVLEVVVKQIREYTDHGFSTLTVPDNVPPSPKRSNASSASRSSGSFSQLPTQVTLRK